MTMLDIDFDFFVREHPNLDWGHSEGGAIALLGDVLWAQRAAGYAARDINLGELLTPPNDPTPEAFWGELQKRGWKFTDDVKVLVSNSHATIGSQWFEHIDPIPSEIIHFDAHHDLGYDERAMQKAEEDGWLDCATWLYTCAMHVWGLDRIRLIYPEWRREHEGDPYGSTKHSLMECAEATLEDRQSALAEASIYLTWEHWLDGVKPPEEPISIITICQSSSWIPPWFDHRFKDFVDAAPGDALWLKDPLWGPEGFKPRWDARTWPEVLELLKTQIDTQRAFYEMHKNGTWDQLHKAAQAVGRDIADTHHSPPKKD